MVLGEVLKEKPQLAQVGQVHEAGIVEDRGQRFAGVIEAEGLLDEAVFTGEGGAPELDTEGVAQDFDGVGVGAQGTADGGDQVLVFGEALDHWRRPQVRGTARFTPAHAANMPSLPRR